MSIAQLVKLSLDSNNNQIVTVLSSGETLSLASPKSIGVIYSIVDGKGQVVRSIHRWLNFLSRHAGYSISPSTVEQYGRTLSYLCRWIEKHPPYPDLCTDENICLLSRYDILEWERFMRDQGAESNNTLHSREACLKQFLDWLTTIEGGNLRKSEDSPWGRDNSLKYVTRRLNAKSPKFISPEMVIAILKEMHNECERCMFHTQYDTGLRIAELVNLRLKDLPDESNYDSTYEFIPLCINGVKGRSGQVKERITLISRAVLKRIRRYHSTVEYKLAQDWDINDPSKPVFLTANQLPWSIRNASKQFKTAVRRAKVEEAFSTHWMRHGTAFSVLKSDIGKSYEDKILTIQQMLGHTHLSTTEIYTQLSPALLTKLTKAGSELDRLSEAEHIRAETFLAPLQHTEKRGHRE